MLALLLEEAFITKEKLKLELAFMAHLRLEMSVMTILDQLILCTVKQTLSKLFRR